MDKSILDRELPAVLRRQIETARVLLDVLREERTALDSRTLAKIQAAAQDKNTLISGLEAQTRELREILREAGVPDTAEDPEKVFAAPGLEPLQEMWRTLCPLLNECRRQNQVNGGKIEMSRRFAQQMLDALRGGIPSERVYGREGTAERDASTNTIAVA